MEREIAFTGIGGQSIQLGAQVLARAAVLEGRQVMLLGTYGGTMRGGNTEATLVVADAPISTPPIVSEVWAALAMHHRYWDTLAPKLRPGGIVAIDSRLTETPVAVTMGRLRRLRALRRKERGPRTRMSYSNPPSW